MAKNKQIAEINKVGQSIWYDNLSRDVVRSGELATLITSGVSGLTSNPTIFKKAIADSSDYDSDIRKIISSKPVGVEDLCEELMLQDVAAAADLLKDIYVSTKGEDGYASVEVSPFLANETQKTIEAAKRIWGKLNRPNIMIKIPATAPSIPAIKAVLELGINVNVTLIFSSEVYNQVAEAYISALETRASKGEKIDHIASVASFFVSRVDAICEKKFDELVKAGKAKEADRASFFGKVGIANSKLAYGRYEELFGAPRFAKLKAKGAKVQRPLWASTGTKSAALSPVLYVEELAGKDTVNTLPPPTLKALMADAKISAKLHAGLKEAKDLVAAVNKLGIPFDALMVDLQNQGVKLFADSYQELLNSIEVKKGSVASASA